MNEKERKGHFKNFLKYNYTYNLYYPEGKEKNKTN